MLGFNRQLNSWAYVNAIEFFFRTAVSARITEPASILSLYYHPLFNICIDLTLLKTPSQTHSSSPIHSLMYGSKSSEARRQYPHRLKLIFEFSGLNGTLEKQALVFLARLKKETN